MERESIHGNDVSSRAGRPACGIVSIAEEFEAFRARGQRQVGDPGRRRRKWTRSCAEGRSATAAAEVLLWSGPRSSTPPVHEFIQKLEKPATLVAPRLAAGSGRALKQNKSVVRWSGERHGCLTAGFFQDAAQPSGSFAGRRRCDGSLVVGSSRRPS